VNPGIRADHRLAAGLALPEARYRPEEIAVFAQQLTERLKALPGVRSAGLVSCPPLSGYCGDNAFTIEGQPLPPGQFRLALAREADPEYFSTAGIPLLSGRVFIPQDGRGFDPNHPKQSAAVISKSMARKFWPAGNALDQRIRFGDGPTAYRIVGIVGDVLTDLDDHVRPTLYTPLLEGAKNRFYAIVRTEADPASLASAVRHEISRLDSDVPAFGVGDYSVLLDESVAHRQFTMLLLASFAGLALLLAAVGLYGVLSYSVAQRTNEIGIRLALGADLGQVRRLVVKDGLRPAILGAAIGFGGAAGAAQLLRSFLFGIGPGDPITYVAVPVMLLMIAAAASWVPACRATRVDPIQALRHE
jgi:putative ABC transport system permease protein